MKTKRERGSSMPVNRITVKRNGERGNALVYVLIAIALFAALSFTLSRTSETEEAGDLEAERAQFYATQMISYATTAKSAIDQMLFVGANIDDLNFVLPGDALFEEQATNSNINKVYHPEGGGLNLGILNPKATSRVETLIPEPGWYMGRFNNVEWTATEANEVILTAYQITRPICENINLISTGSIAIPILEDSIRELLISSEYTGIANRDLTTESDGVCPECDGQSTMCVQNSNRNAYAFYTILADQ